MDIEVIPELHCQLGEIPLWDPARGHLYVVDVTAPAVVRFDAASRQVKRWRMPSFVGSMALTTGGGAIVALANGVHSLDLGSGETALIANPEPNEPEKLFTEAQVDPGGRFVFSTFDLSMEKPTGCLYALDRDRTVRRLLEGLYAPNGICWSPDGAQMYLTDSVLKTVFRFDYDAERGQIANRTVFVETSEFTGAPDGAAIDADGHYWVAMCGGGELLRFDTAGKLERRVAMPGAFVTGLAFGGARLDEIYVTSLHPSILRQDGSGGETYVVREAGVRGLPQRRFDG